MQTSSAILMHDGHVLRPVAAVLNALANLSRLRALRLDELSADTRARVGAPHDGA